MRKKARKPVGQEDELMAELAAGFLEEPLPPMTVAVAYKLVRPMTTIQPLPAVVMAATARVRKGAAAVPTGIIDLGAQPWPLPHASSSSLLPAPAAAAQPAPPLQRAAAVQRRVSARGAGARAASGSPKPAAEVVPPKPTLAATQELAATAKSAASPKPPAARVPPPKPEPASKPAAAPKASTASKPARVPKAPATAKPTPSVPEASVAPATTASGRPARKRKQTSMGDDMIPPDAILRPFTKPKRTFAGGAAQPEVADQSAPTTSTKPQRLPPKPLMLPLPPLPPAPPPYKVVAPGPPAQTPVVVLAATASIAHLAKQQEEEERRRAAEAADAVVMVQVLQKGQPLQQAQHLSAAKGKKKAAPGGGKNSKAVKVEKPSTSRQRPPRPSRRSTPEPSMLQQGAAAATAGVPGRPPGMWQQGMEVHGGVTYIDPVQSANAAPPPVVVVGVPPRWQQVPPSRLAAEEFSADPLRASIEFAKYMARTVGRLPAYSGPLQQAVNAEQRLYKERLQRAAFARDGRKLQPTCPEATRRSTRTRQAPKVFLPTTTQEQTARRLQVVHTAGPEDQTAVRMGAEYQAELPTLRARPAAPAQDEAQWLSELIMEPHSPDVPAVPLSELAAMAAAGDAERAAWVESSQQQLSAAVGSLAAISLGLETMGACIAGSWTEEEEEALCVGMRAYGRDFHAIQQDYVPSRSVHDLIDYYYNVLKLKATRHAVQWHQEKAQAVVERQAELERQEQAREAELQRKAERQDGINKRRQLREVVGWLKAAAKNPKDAAFNRPVLERRAGRAAKLVRSLNAPGAQ